MLETLVQDPVKLVKTELFYEKDIDKAADMLLRGGVVAFPTETVYGLGACIFLEKAIKRLFTVKGRPKDNPVIAHVCDLGSVELIAHSIPSNFYKLAERFFPGPLTLVLPRASRVPSVVSAGLPTIAVRMPRHPLALSLIRTVGQPIVAPSANLSGKPSATDFLHVLEDFDGLIPGVIVGDESDVGIESTVLSLLKGRIEILRPGVIRKEEIEECLGMNVGVYNGESKHALISPGMKYRHYAPDAKVFLFDSVAEAEVHCKKNTDVKRLILSNLGSARLDRHMRFPLASPSFYSRLRLADRSCYEEVVLVLDDTIKRDPALMNRIEKASGTIYTCAI